MNSIIKSIILIPAILSFGMSDLKTSAFSTSQSNENIILERESENNSILILGSYSIEWLSYSYYIEGISNVFSYEDYDVTYEFMNTKKIDYTSDYYDFLDGYYNDIYSNGEFDAVITLDDDALDFAMKARQEDGGFMSQLPVLFVGVNNLDFADEARKKENVYGISEIFDYPTYIKNSISLVSDKKVINYITDSSSTGQGLEQAFLNAIEEVGGFEEVKAINSSNLTFDELTDAISAIPQSQATFYLAANFDVDGNYYNLNAQRLLIEDYSNSPVFSNNTPISADTNPYTGYIDYDYVGAAEEIATETISLLNGSDEIFDHIWDESDLCKYVYDEKLMNYYGLEFEEIPQKVSFINQSTELFAYGSSGYKILAIVSPLVVIFIFTLFYLYFRNRGYNKEMNKIIELVKFNAQHDYLTGVKEGYLFDQDVEKMIKKDKKFAILVIDIDNMSDTNSFYGRTYGDEVIKTTVDKISKIDDFDYEIYRIGGDKLGIIYPYEQEDDLNFFVNKLDTSGINKFIKDQSNFYISTTIGISIYPRNLSEDQNYLDLIDKAFIAMKRGKVKGKKEIEYFDDTMVIGKKNSEIYTMLLDAINDDGFEVIYQPIVNLKTGDVAKYEALLRIKENRLSPGIFIPVAEDTGLIGKIGRIVIEKAANFVRKMNEKNVYKHVSTNFSFNQFADTDFISHYRETAKNNNISISDLDIELTESVSMRTSQEKFEFFKFFQENGIQLSLDDFGTGYSSLSSLFSIPISFVKIDKALAESLCENESSSRTLIKFFHRAGLKVIIEGIEEKKQVEVMKRCDADYIQGYYFSKPLSEEDTLKNIHVNYMDKII